ncbi:MAG TPA: saccharopine dehydrogenase C-terminal domain-containing protein [Thermoanaerobaculia bacterium]|nr:saccharopine dehydrogenase C-terminal domain-containing protein [Thermoanaerobaculia bacterium]
MRYFPAPAMDGELDEAETMKITVLGSGRVGSTIARDLAAEPGFEVTAVDASAAALARLGDVPRLSTLEADLADPAAVQRAVAGADLVAGAVPGFLGFATVQAVLQAGKDIVDISFFDEDPFRLDELAKARGLTALVDCGVAPGCSNLILGRAAGLLDRVNRFACYVGGLPAVRAWPFELKAVFSPIDVIEEYTRPARFLRGGRPLTLPALSEVEPLDFAGVGTLEAFNTDGLRTLIQTLPVPDMVEKTLRYPGHADRMRMLRETGFFGREPIEAGGVRVRPLDVTARLLFSAWQLGEGEEDLTVMRVIVEGEKAGRATSYRYDLLDRYDRATGTTSMARTTGYTCTAIVRLVAAGLYTRKGISPPEFVGQEPEAYAFVLRELAERGVVFRETVTPGG